MPAFRHLKMNKVYVPFRVPVRTWRSSSTMRPALGFKGLSVTIPHKEEILQQLSEADGVGRGIGAANTVVFQAGRRAATTPIIGPP